MPVQRKRVVEVLGTSFLVMVSVAMAVADAGAPPSRAAAPALREGGTGQQRITPGAVGQVRVGASYQRLRERGLVGRLRPGCELSGPGVRFARLRAPLSGSVDLTRGSPRRVKRIVVTGGATARGVGVGARLSRIRRSFPRAKVSHRTDELFGITLVSVPPGRGGSLQFAVSTRSGRVTLIGVPRIPFCE